ncbi:hypothetical protein KAJ89_01690 [Candidatus Parcubacteria bacterium]|nr:hypothetical protein [Candidatus Parcubacteria bacterium]
MLKTKRSDFVLVVIVMFSMLTMYAYMPMAQAASMDNALTRLSDSDKNILATSTIEFELGDANFLTAAQYVRITYELGFTGMSSVNLTCPSGTTASTTGTSDTYRVVECNVTSFLTSTSTVTITVGNHTNPNPGVGTAYSVWVSSHQSNGTEIEQTETKVYIIDDVQVTATVPATLTFGVGLLGTSSARSSINGVDLTGSSTATTLAFGTLDPTASSTLGHELTVSTNASAGYSVTVQQDAELTNGAADTINSFFNAPDGQGSSTNAVAWGAPSAVLGSTETYGHMGVTSDDTNANPDYSGGLYAGLSAATKLEVMTHDGPANGAGEGVGIAGVAYTIEISALQEAGDYTSNLTYVCTPTY